MVRAERRRRLITAAAGLLLLISRRAYAQFGTIVSDPPTEQNTGSTVSALGTANSTLTQIQSADQATAASVTTGGGAGLFQGVAPFLDTLDAGFNNTVNAQAFNTIFPGWLPLPADAIPQDETIAAMGLATYQAALQIAAQQAADFDAEDTHFGAIEAANGASGAVLNAIQANTEAVLALAQQVQMERQLLITLITLEGARSGEELNERAQQAATFAQSANQEIAPQ